METTLRRNAFATTALSVVLIAPGVALAEETCIEVLGTINSNMEAAELSTDGRVQADALIITARQADGRGTCIDSLEELQAMVGGDRSRLAVDLSISADASAGTAGTDATATTVGEDAAATEDTSADMTTADAGSTAERAPTVATHAEMDAVAVPETDAEAEASADAGATVTAEAPLGNAAEMLAGLAVGEAEGMDVLSPEGDDIGTVEFFVVDTEDRVNVVISLDDGVLGLGDSERVVALDQFDFSAEEEALVLVQLSEEWLETMPEYDSDTPGYVQIDADAHAFSN